MFRITARTTNLIDAEPSEKVTAIQDKHVSQ